MTTISIYIGLQKSCSYYNVFAIIVVSDPIEIKCNSYENTGFRYVTHKIYPSFVNSYFYQLEFLIFSEKSECYNTLTFLNNGSTEGEDTIECKSGSIEVYVYFYGNDPRPLLVCYNNKAYIPKGKDNYDKEWVKVENGITKCVCEGTDECVNCDKLVEKLITVVGFLNEVNLSMRPTGTDGNSICGNSAVGTANTCNAATEKNGQANTCTYVVDTYKSKPVRVKVTCEPVKPNGETPGTSCYKKLTHQPAGLSGEGATTSDGGSANGSGFRLGDVVYNSKTHGSIDYYTNGENRSTHWRQPLVSVSAYFYDADKCYKDPLLVVLEFKKNGAGNVFEYYKLILTSGSGDMKWEIDREACEKVADNSELVKHLDNLRYDLKKVLKVELKWNTNDSYQAMGRDGKSDTKNGFKSLNGGDKTITVAECTSGLCKKLSENKYKCFQHYLTGLGDDFDYNLIGGLAFTIPGQNEKGIAGKFIEIKLFNGAKPPASDCQNGKQIPQITYNRCMGDVYVFFYGTGSDTRKPDTVPLMLWYHDSYYKPCDRDKYFEKWVKVQVPGLTGKPCESGDTALITQLNEVNRAMNQIDLDPEKASKAESGTGRSGYGIPENGEGITVDKSKFLTMRISLTKQEGPKEPSQTPPPPPAYVKIVHRTYNGFTIGEIKYGQQNFADNGVKINGASGGDVTIKVKNGGNHKDLVKKHNCNTVVAYYSTSDTTYKLPQLIVILKTGGPVSQGGPVTTSADYGYYILSSKDVASGAPNGAANGGYEYVWREVNGPGQQTPVKLDSATDFSLLNSIVILLDKKCKNGAETTYKDDEIKKAITSAIEKQPSISSPGQEVGEINRLKGRDKTIKVTDATTESEGKCLQKYGYKLCKHDFTDLVENGLVSGVKLIAGLRFLMPCKDKDEGSYVQLTLYEGSDTRYLYYQKSKTQFYVYFYQGIDAGVSVGDGTADGTTGDPRPLMLCYGESLYKPTNIITYFYWWDKDTNIKNCICDVGCSGDGECDKLLTALVNVSNFLNQLDIRRVPNNNEKPIYYCVHWFNGNLIKIKVESVKAAGGFCYHRYTHKHHGTGTDGKGFRLGTIRYGEECIEENGASSKKTTNGDKCITSQLVNEGTSNNYKSADQVVVFYYQGDTKLERPLLVALSEKSSDTCNLYYELQKGDDKGAKLYTQGTNGAINVNETNSGSELEKKLDNIRYNIAITLQIILDKKIKYYGKMYEKKNGDKEVECQNKEIKVGNPTDVKLEKGQKTGYKCYVHNLLKVENVDQIGGLKFYLWDNTGGSGGGAGASGSPSCPSPAGGSPSNSCPDAGDNCRELCLYGPSSGVNSASGASSSCPATVAKTPDSTCTEPTPSKRGEKKLKPVTTSYTTCKGNVYVYFYGDDPRPLMLCFAGNAYIPFSLKEYDKKWINVSEINKCDCSKSDFDSTQVLCHLYKTSMFLNPVELGHTKCAFHHEKPDKKCVNGVHKGGGNGQAQSARKDPYKYPIHTYNKTPVNVTVSSTDLSCYRRYVHRPEKTGFRLGEVSYYTKNSSDRGLCYNTSKQLLSVSLYYYMYDCEHKYPLIIELGFKGEVSEYFRYDHTKNLKWVKMVDQCCNKNGQTNNCKNKCAEGSYNNNQVKKTICELDADFARNARLIEKKMIHLNKASPEFPYEYMKLNSQLIARIEHRAYQIRKGLLVKWQKDTEYLIMKTDENCHEESMLVYVLRGGAMGGAVGVAGGGGWKALVFMLGLLVKL